MKEHWAIKIWNDREYFDLWHLNHFLAGVLLASAGILVGLDFTINFIIALCAMVAWEIFEIIKDIYETLFNRSFDVIFGVCAFFLVYKINLQVEKLDNLFFTTLIIWVFIQLWGFYAYKVRGGNKRRSPKI